MNKKFMQAVFFVFIFTPFFCSADTTISLPVTSDTTWSPSGGVYTIDGNFSVASGTTLNIEAGTIVKFKNSSIAPSIYGKLIVSGTSESPVFFTSVFDDATSATWPGIYFAAGSEGLIDHLDLSFGGYCGSSGCFGIRNEGGDVIIKNSNIHDNISIVSNGAGGGVAAGMGIHNKSGSLRVFDSIVANNAYGIFIESGTAEISNNIIKNNRDSTGYSKGYGVFCYNQDSLILLNNKFEGNDKTANIDTSKSFTHEGNTSSDRINRGFEVGGNILGNVSLHSRDLPIIILNLIVHAGGVLNIEPGTVIKMNDYYSTGSLYVYGGQIIAKGTEDKKIYITSLKDDSVGGDTNGDGDTTSPAPKNWASIFLESGSKVEFDNVALKYGGYNWNGEYYNIAAAIYQRGADLSVNNSVFDSNKIADIFQDAGTTTVTNSEFKNTEYAVWARGSASIKISNSSFINKVVAVNNESPKQIDARENWWGSDDGPKNLSNPEPTGNGAPIVGDILYIPFLTQAPTSSTTPGQINPVIIIPGIMGSAKKNGEWLIDPILHTYDDLIDTFITNGYEKNKNLFPFPYEWRDSNMITSSILKDKISSVKQTCQTFKNQDEMPIVLGEVDCSKVDVIAHSMGGLVARAYIQSNGYQNDIDQLIFLGTPHKGAPKAYIQWEAGEFSPNDQLSILLKIKFGLEAIENFYSSVFSYIHNRPISSVQELLPIFDYIKDKDTGIVRNYPNNYPRNVFLESLNTNSGISKLLNSGVNITNIIGNTGQNTISVIRVGPNSNPLWIDGKPDGFDGSTSDHGLEKGEGDGTVTTYGATLDSSVINKISNSDHSSLPSTEENNVFNILANKNSTTNIHRNIIQKLLVIQLESPIDVVITAPNGKKIGKNFATGGEYNEIAEAFYSGFNNEDEEYITIPNPLDGEYKIEVQGTGSGGEYGVVTSFISGATSTTNQITGITTSNQITQLGVSVNNQNQNINQTERVIDLVTFIGDINGAYDLKWIKDKNTKNHLVNQVKLIIKLEKRIETITEKLPNGKKIQKKIEKTEKKIDKVLARLLYKELSVLLKTKKINQQAFDLFKTDLYYLLNN